MAQDKKDISVLIEGQIPEFITTDHPKFKTFIEKYYEFMESHELYFDAISFNEDKLVPEDENYDYFQLEDGDNGVNLQLESERDTDNNANLQFVIGETLTGNTSGATAVVTGTKGNTHAFVKPTNNAVFQYAEVIVGGTTRAYSTLANGILDGTFPTGAIESFRSRGAVAATKELPDMQDIDKTNEGLIDDAWKKEFYTNVPRATETDRRQLLKRMKQVYRSKGNESSFTWLFRTVFAKEDVEFYYPKTDLMKLSYGSWALDKTIKIATASAVNLDLFTGRRITGLTSKCTALVEKSITTSVGNLLATELTLSDIIEGVDDDGGLSFFLRGERVNTEVDADGEFGYGWTSGIVKTVEVIFGGTDYSVGEDVSISGGSGQDARARVTSIADNVIEGITILDSGDGYAVGDALEFVDEGTSGVGAAAEVGTIIKTGELIQNSDLIDTYKITTLDSSSFGGAMAGHNANTHLFGNSAVIFQSTIKDATAKYFDSTSTMWSTQFITAGDQLRKQVTFDETSVGQLTQSGTTVTFATGMTEAQRRDVVGGKLTYANSNTTIITGYTNSTVFSVKDTHTIGSAQNWDIYYGSNTTWATIIGANSSQILYSVGSYYRDPDLDAFSANNFANNDYVVVYDASRTGAWAAKSANSHDSQSMHNGIIFQIGNTPASVNTAATSEISYTQAFGNTSADATHVTIGALNMSTVNIGAINTCTMTAGGEGYQSSPLITVLNSYVSKLNNSLDVLGANNALVNLNLHSYDTGTITQSSNVVTIVGGTFPDANSGVLKLTYANGAVDNVVSVTNSTSLRTTTEKSFGTGEVFSLTYMAMANNFTRSSKLYNDDYSARACVLDFIDLSKTVRPTIPTGNTVLRLDMLTANDFSATTEYVRLEDGSAYNSGTFGDIVAYEDDLADGLFLGSSRIFTEATVSDRLTAHSHTTTTANSGTIAQSGTTITLSGSTFPNDLVRGTITYSGHDDSTAIITGYTNSTSITVDTSKTINASNTYSIAYNSVVTWGAGRSITAAGGGSGNRTVTVTDTGHYLRTGDKVKISGALSALVNGVHAITLVNSNSYSFLLPHDGVATVSGVLVSTVVVSAWSASYNTYTVDTSPKGNNATISVSGIGIGAIKTVDVYNFGAGYTDVPTVTTTTGDENATLTATLGAFAEYSGYYVGSQGLLSGTPKIQDNYYYQDFSYVLKTDLDVTDYRDQVKRLTHPSGMLLFGEVAFRNRVTVEMFDAAERNINTTEEDTTKTAGGDSPKYRLTVISSNSYANLQYQSSNTSIGIEVFTAGHPWQAMDARLGVRADNNLLEEDYRDVTIARTTSTTLTVTDTLHGLAVGDTIQIAGFPQGLNETDYWDAKYVIQTAPTTNTYTVTAQRGDPGVGVTADPYFYAVLDSTNGSADAGDNILAETGESFIYEPSIEYLKVETITLANVWLENSSDWNAPFNSALVMEDATDPSADNNEKILLEPGGSFLYPVLQFPEAEAGTVSIDMSFNSDVLLEDNNEEGSGYVLEEVSGTMGNGPQRYISLEEDTDGIEEGHIAQSIPYMETRVITNLLDSMHSGLLMEDDGVVICEEGLYDIDDIITLEDDTYLLTEDNLNLIWNSVGQRLAERSRLITEEDMIFDGSFAPDIMIIDHFSTSILGKILSEDYGGYIINEDDSTFVAIEGFTSSNNQIEFNLLSSVRDGLQTEDGLNYIMFEDSEYDELSATRLIIEEQKIKDTVSREIEYNLVDTFDWHLMMENDDHHIYEDETRLLTEEDHAKDFFGVIQKISTAGTGRHIGMEDGYHYLYEDESFPLREKEDINHVYPWERIITPVESIGWHILAEDGVEHLAYEDGTRLITEDIEIKSTLQLPMVIDDALTASLHGTSVISGYQDSGVPGTWGLQPFRPHNISQWSEASGMFADDKFIMEDDTGTILLEHPVVNTNYLIVEDYSAVLEDIMNPFRETLDFILMEDQSGVGGHGGWSESDPPGGPGRHDLDYIQYETATMLEFSSGVHRALLETSKVPEEGYGSENTPGQFWTVLPAYQYTRVLTRLNGKITFADEGTTGTGTGTSFTAQLKVGDEFQTADENIIAEDTGGDIVMETDERIRHEDVTIADIQNEIAFSPDTRDIPIEDFWWLISTEESDIPAHNLHDGVIGTYSFRDTSLESYWIVTSDSTDDLKIQFQESGSDIGNITQESPEWENNNMIWEDFSKQLITEPQAFMVGSITNDTSLSVTRKHLGGVSDSIYQM